MNHDELRRRFETNALVPGEFDHASHVFLAWDCLRRHSVPETMIRIRHGLKTFTAQIGKEEKYHETVTCAFVSIIAERRFGCPQDDWDCFRESNNDLFDQPKTLLARYYRPETLASDLARQVFILPDRLHGCAA